MGEGAGGEDEAEAEKEQEEGIGEVTGEGREPTPEQGGMGGEQE